MSRRQRSTDGNCTPTLQKLILFLIFCIAVVSIVSAIFFFFGQSTVNIPSSSSNLNAFNEQSSEEKISVRGAIGRSTEKYKKVENRDERENMVDNMNTDHNGPPQTPQEQDIENFLADQKQSQTLRLNMPHGSILINLRPDLSHESVQHINELLDASSKPCSPCRFYRSERDLLLQGILKKSDGPPPNKVLGPCPPEYQNKQDTHRKCPSHDPNCGCHGPIMTRGMVAWAGGGGGPDFFINMYHKPVDWWSNDHTVWGEIADSESLQLIEQMFGWDTTVKNGMTFLNNEVHFDISRD